MSLATGDRLGPYEIVGPIGSGGMGEVYRARDTRLDRTVAIRILSEALAADPQFRERFDREAKAISHLDHPHICTLHDNATDAGVGLARPSDAQFTLTTTVAPGTETANAATDSRQVCDALDNCVTAGPITGHHIDMKAPVITITSPAARAYLVNDPAAAQYTCVDAEAATCAGSASNGAPLDTAAPGPRSFTVNATDGAGNTSSATTTYSVEYGVRALFDQSQPYERGTIPVKVQLVDSRGTNLSSPSIVVTVTGLTFTSAKGTFAMPMPSTDLVVRFDPKSAAYGYAIKSNSLPAGTYRLEFKAGTDTTTHTVTFSVR